MDSSQIKEVWKKDGKGLIIPKIVLAYDKNREKFFVYEDHSTILYLLLDKTNETFVIPKKYCKVVGDVYKIMDNKKLIPISCYKKNEYQLFVQKYLIGK